MISDENLWLFETLVGKYRSIHCKCSLDIKWTFSYSALITQLCFQPLILICGWKKSVVCAIPNRLSNHELLEGNFVDDTSQTMPAGILIASFMLQLLQRGHPKQYAVSKLATRCWTKLLRCGRLHFVKLILTYAKRIFVVLLVCTEIARTHKQDTALTYLAKRKLPK
jgi:hypothetical protein